MPAAAEWRRLPRLERAALVEPIVTRHATKAGVPANVIMGIVEQESDFSPWATATHPGDLARGGAYGLMQMTLETARGMGYTGAAGDVAQLSGLYDPDVNVALGVRHFADLLKAAGGRADVAISAYNAGLSRERAGDGKRTANDPAAPFINQSYVDRVSGFAKKYATPLVAGGSTLVLVLAIGALWFFSRRAA